MCTHQEYVQQVAAIALARLPEDEREQVQAHITYGAGQPGLRGVTYYGAWQSGGEQVPFVEVCAFGEESAIQLAGTTIHELGHVLAGMGTGHSKAWKQACYRLGLRAVKAAGTRYSMAMLAPDIRYKIAEMPDPSDGRPVGLHKISGPIQPKPCPMGTGTRGGTSRGKGSGSRLRKYECDCGVKVRVSSDDFRATCDRCGTSFKRS